MFDKKLNKKRNLSNLEIQGYSIEQTPTEANAGVVLMYISNKIKYKIRTDLCIYKPKELESLFVELFFPKQKNMILGCIYRHPNKNTDEFDKKILPDILLKMKENLSY